MSTCGSQTTGDRRGGNLGQEHRVTPDGVPRHGVENVKRKKARVWQDDTRKHGPTGLMGNQKTTRDVVRVLGALGRGLGEVGRHERYVPILLAIGLKVRCAA